MWLMVHVHAQYKETLKSLDKSRVGHSYMNTDKCLGPHCKKYS